MRRSSTPFLCALVLLSGAFLVPLNADQPPVFGRDRTGTGTLRLRPVLADVPPAESGITGTIPAEQTAAAKAAIESCSVSAVLALPTIPTTSRADDKADRCIVAESRDGKQRFLLGPSALEGKGGVSGAKPRFTSGQGWVVDMNLTDSGSAKFNTLAAKAYLQPPPANQVAIVLDGVVQSNPAFQAPSFSGGRVQISGDFTKREVTNLAKLMSRRSTGRS